jgi:UPF0271 protein
VSSRRTIDINADAGESYGPWRMGADELLFPALTSVNVACGFHAGDPVTIRRTLELADRERVAIGAHPGFPDRDGFGRRDLAMTPDELHAAVLYQLGALAAFLRPSGRRLHHVKPHGALHHRIVRDADAADAVAAAIHAFDPDVPFVVLAGPGGGTMRAAAERHGLPTVQEAFPDRGYLASGHLAPRGSAGSMVTDPEVAADRAVRMVVHGEIESVDGSVTRVEVDTLCIHGDNDGSHAIARAIRAALEAADVEVRAF